MPFGQIDEAWSEKANSKAVRSPDAHSTGRGRLGTVHATLHRKHLGLDPLEGIEKRNTRISKLATMGSANQEFCSHGSFKGSHPSRQCGLVDAQGARST